MQIKIILFYFFLFKNFLVCLLSEIQTNHLIPVDSRSGVRGHLVQARKAHCDTNTVKSGSTNVR